MAVRRSAAAAGNMTGAAETWIDREVAAFGFKDARLRERFRKLLGQMSGAAGAPIRS